MVPSCGSCVTRRHRRLFSANPHQVDSGILERGSSDTPYALCTSAEAAFSGNASARWYPAAASTNRPPAATHRPDARTGCRSVPSSGIAQRMSRALIEMVSTFDCENVAALFDSKIRLAVTTKLDGLGRGRCCDGLG